MLPFKRLLGHHKSKLKWTILQFIFINKLRLRIAIGKKCKIANDLIYGDNVQIRDYVSIGNKVRLGDGVIVGNYASLSNLAIGENSHIESGVKLTGSGKGKIQIGKETYIGINNVLDWSDNISIGDFVHIAGPSTGIWTHSSAGMCMNSIPLSQKSEVYRPTASVTIRDNVYIGGNCTIYPGVTIGKNSIIAPNSAVTRNVDPYTMVGGVPAKLIKNLEINK